jgi:hypothetical protein
MAKPTDTIQQIATDTNFSTSPVAAVNGQPTKVALATPAEGLIPGKAAGAANLNWLWNTANKFLQWVKDGTDQPDKTAHIVETDSGGVINAAGVLVSQGTGYTFGISAVNDDASTSSYAIQGMHIADGIGVYGRNQFGSGTGVVGLCDGDGGDGVLGQAAGTGPGGGVHGQGFGTVKAGVWAERTVDNDFPALLVTGDHASPQRALVRIGTQDEPAVASLGDLHVSSVDYRIVQGGGWATIQYRPEGCTDAIADDAGPVSVGTGSYSDVETITVTVPRVGKVVITATMMALPAPGAAINALGVALSASSSALLMVVVVLRLSEATRLYTVPLAA